MASDMNRSRVGCALHSRMYVSAAIGNQGRTHSARNTGSRGLLPRSAARDRTGAFHGGGGAGRKEPACLACLALPVLSFREQTPDGAAGAPFFFFWASFLSPPHRMELQNPRPLSAPPLVLLNSPSRALQS